MTDPKYYGKEGYLLMCETLTVLLLSTTEMVTLLSLVSYRVLHVSGQITVLHLRLHPQ